MSTSAAACLQYATSGADVVKIPRSSPTVPRHCCQRRDDVLNGRERLSLQSTHLRGESWHFMFSVLLCRFCILTGGQVWNVFPFFFFPFSQSCRSLLPNAIQTELCLEGIWNETPQRPCLGIEIALAMAFCHVASTVHINYLWHVA